MKNIITKVDSQIGSQVSSYMCSLTCPCSIKDNKANITDWTLMTDAELSSFSRAAQLGNSYQDNRGYQRLFFTDDSQYKTYSTYLQCQDDIIGGTRAVPDVQKKSFSEVAGANTFSLATKLVSYFEREFKCSGLCKPSLFYYGLPPSLGRPKQSCMLIFKREITNKLQYMGIVTFFAGVFTFVTWVLQYFLWRKYK